MRFGHLAFSHTVSKFNSERMLDVRWFAFPLGTSRRNQEGSRRDGWKVVPAAAEPQTPDASESALSFEGKTTGSEKLIGETDPRGKNAMGLELYL